MSWMGYWPEPITGGPSRTSYPLAKMFNEEFKKKFGSNPEWGANAAYMQIAMWADAVERAGSFYPRQTSLSRTRRAPPSSRRSVRSTFRPEDHQLVRPVIILRGKSQSKMKSKDDYYDVVEIVDGADR